MGFGRTSLPCALLLVVLESCVLKDDSDLLGEFAVSENSWVSTGATERKITKVMEFSKLWDDCRGMKNYIAKAANYRPHFKP